MQTNIRQQGSGFQELDPNTVLLLAEESLGRDFSNLFRPFNSYINRVYELEDLQGDAVIIKFYRPGRWPLAAIQEEHFFLQELQEHDVPVIAPLSFADGTTLAEWHGVPYACFPKCGGRILGEFTKEQWQELGRLVGRVHVVGAAGSARQRMVMLPAVSTAGHVAYLKKHRLIPGELEKTFFSLVTEILEFIGVMFSSVSLQRIHGDLHLANIIYRPGESFFLIDFDDMVVGPPVHDIWMLLPGTVEDSLEELEDFLEGYETFNRFDRSTLKLIEPLRAMRYLHYLAWCGYQMVEDGGTEVMPDFGSFSFWRNEIAEMADQMERIRSLV